VFSAIYSADNLLFDHKDLRDRSALDGDRRGAARFRAFA
jgi:hypothetical protein